MFLCIHKTLSVIHVIEGFRGHIIHFYWYYVHLTSLEPIFWSSEQDAQNKRRSPPPQKKITFIEQNNFVMQQNQQNPHIYDHSDAFCSHPVCRRSYKRPKCALIAYRSRNISHGLLLHPGQVRSGYCFTPYQRLRLYNGAPFSRLLRHAGDTEDPVLGHSDAFNL